MTTQYDKDEYTKSHSILELLPKRYIFSETHYRKLCKDKNWWAYNNPNFGRYAFEKHPALLSSRLGLASRRFCQSLLDRSVRVYSNDSMDTSTISRAGLIFGIPCKGDHAIYADLNSSYPAQALSYFTGPYVIRFEPNQLSVWNELAITVDNDSSWIQVVRDDKTFFASGHIIAQMSKEEAQVLEKYNPSFHYTILRSWSPSYVDNDDPLNFRKMYRMKTKTFKVKLFMNALIGLFQHQHMRYHETSVMIPGCLYKNGKYFICIPEARYDPIFGMTVVSRARAVLLDAVFRLRDLGYSVYATHTDSLLTNCSEEEFRSVFSVSNRMGDWKIEEKGPFIVWGPMAYSVGNRRRISGVSRTDLTIIDNAITETHPVPPPLVLNDF